MATITIKLEGIQNFRQLSQEKVRAVIEAGEKVEKKYGELGANLMISKIHHRSGHFRELIGNRIDGKGRSYVVAHFGLIGASAKDAIAFNAYNYGHASPGDAGGVKIVNGSHVLEQTADEIKGPFKNDMKSAIKSAIEG